MDENVKSDDLKVIFLMEKFISKYSQAYCTELKEDVMIEQVGAYVKHKQGGPDYPKAPLSDEELELMYDDKGVRDIIMSLLSLDESMRKGNLKSSINLYGHDCLNRRNDYSMNRAKYMGNILCAKINEYIMTHYEEMMKVDPPTKDNYLNSIRLFVEQFQRQVESLVVDIEKETEKNGMEGKTLRPEALQKFFDTTVDDKQKIIMYTKDLGIKCATFTQKEDSETEIAQSKESSESNRLKLQIQYFLYRTKVMDRMNTLSSGMADKPKGLFGKSPKDIEKATAKQNRKKCKSAEADIESILKEYKSEVKALTKSFKKQAKLQKKAKGKLLGPGNVDSEKSLEEENEGAQLTEDASVPQYTGEVKLNHEILMFYDSLLQDADKLKALDERKLKINLSKENQALLVKLERKEGFIDSIRDIQRKHSSELRKINGLEIRTGEGEEKIGTVSTEFKESAIEGAETTKNIVSIRHRQFAQYDITSTSTYSFILRYLGLVEDYNMSKLSKVTTDYRYPNSTSYMGLSEGVMSQSQGRQIKMYEDMEDMEDMIDNSIRREGCQIINKDEYDECSAELQAFCQKYSEVESRMQEAAKKHIIEVQNKKREQEAQMDRMLRESMANTMMNLRRHRKDLGPLSPHDNHSDQDDSGFPEK